MRKAPKAGRFRRSAKNFFRRLSSLGLIAIILWLGVSPRVFSADASMTESQVKALCLFNFAKYVTWPTEAFSGANAPFYFGVIGQSKLAADLKNAVNHKFIDGHRIEIVEPENEADWRKCHLVFIGAAETGRVREILDKIRTLPLLTVGESGTFAEAGGIINFVKKENKVRFEVDLNAARLARLQISSKLLSLADVVRGKQQ